MNEAINWSVDSFCLGLATLKVESIAGQVYELTCRTDFDKPGFCVISLDAVASSVSLRSLMVSLKNAMDSIHASRTGGKLIYLSASRFDQKLTTRPHLDGGPDECFLMLGYEPSNIKSEIEISDYAKCAHDLGLTPKEFMVEHNPMFQEGCKLLQPYTTRVPCFPSSGYQIICINNSSAPYTVDHSTWQGVLHTATMKTAVESEQRVLNSTMIGSAPEGQQDVISQPEQIMFIHSSDVGSLQ